MLYGLVIFFSLVSHDFYYEDRAEDYISRKESSKSSQYIAQSILFLVELTLLFLFSIDMLLSTLGYGYLYARHISQVFLAILVMANVGLIIYMYDSVTRSKNLFGIKIFFAMGLFIFLLDTLRVKVSIMQKARDEKNDKTGKVFPSKNDREEAAKMESQIGVVSVRDKVISELRSV